MRTAARLALYKKRAADSVYPRKWQDCRYGSMKGYRKTAPCFTHHDGVIYADDFDVIGTKVADAHELVKLNHTGWYSDIFEYGVIRGAVTMLRTAKGVYYIPATYCTEWDGMTLHMKAAELVEKGATEDKHEDAKKEAARSADHYAEREAEKAREDDEKYRAEERCEEFREEINTTRETIRELITEIKEHGAFSPAICATLRKTLRTEWEQVQNLRTSIKELTLKPYMIHEYR